MDSPGHCRVAASQLRASFDLHIVVSRSRDQLRMQEHGCRQRVRMGGPWDSDRLVEFESGCADLREEACQRSVDRGDLLELASVENRVIERQRSPGHDYDVQPGGEYGVGRLRVDVEVEL